MEKPYLSGNLKLDEEALKRLFVCNLNHIYLILIFLTECLPVIAKAACYGDLENVINELLSEVKIQLFRVNDIFIQLDLHPAEKCSSNDNRILQMLIHQYEYEQMDNLSKDLSIVFHLQKILTIKENYFQTLKSIANSLNSINIKQHLQYSCDECRSNKETITLVAKEYMESSINTFLK